MSTAIVFAPDDLARQLSAILQAWGMPSDQARSTVDIMMYADLRGIESHGLLIASLARSIGASNADLSNAAA